MIYKNVDPLLRWAAEKEFTAENVIFLRKVRDFKRRWQQVTIRETPPLLTLRERFEEAAIIYFTCVNPETARFPINLSDSIQKKLGTMFSSLRYVPIEPGEVTRNIVTPWEDNLGQSQSTSSTEDVVPDDVERLYTLPVTEIETIVAGSDEKKALRSNRSRGNLGVPKSFGVEVFDEAYESIRYLVFTNTWVR